jgi:hypothetical protein
MLMNIFTRLLQELSGNDYYCSFLLIILYFCSGSLVKLSSQIVGVTWNYMILHRNHPPRRMMRCQNCQLLRGRSWGKSKRRQKLVLKG